MQAFAMLAFTFTKIMKVRLPLVVLLKVFGGVLRHQNVTGIAAIHDALGDVDSGAGNISVNEGTSGKYKIWTVTYSVRNPTSSGVRVVISESDGTIHVSTFP